VQENANIFRRGLFSAAVACALMLAAPALADHRNGGHSSAGHWGGSSGWHYHPGWHGNIRHFDHSHWRGGHWWHGTYATRLGWWWIVGPDWYWYAEPVYPNPDPYTPPGAVPGFWYWCDYYRQYYPYVGVCPSGWRALPAQ
jgi:hypothetical protein